MPTPEVERATKTDNLCEGCGACCAPGILGQGTEPYLEITPDDFKDGFKSKTRPKVKPKTTYIDMIDEEGHLFLPVVRGENDFTQCEHLVGQVLCGASCSCYATRPTACRIFVPGSDICQRVRQAWIIHQDKVAWARKANPNLTHDEAVYVVLRSGRYGRPLDGEYDGRLLESLGRGPDYIYLRERRDVEKAEEERKKKVQDNGSLGEAVAVLKDELIRHTRKPKGKHRVTRRTSAERGDTKQESPKKTKSPA